MIKKSVATWLRKLAERADPTLPATQAPRAALSVDSGPVPVVPKAVVTIPTAYINEVSDAYALVAHVERLSDAIGAGRRPTPSHGH